MNLYEMEIEKEIKKWDKQMTKSPTLLNKLSKTVQRKTQSFIPKKVQEVLTQAIQTMTQGIMIGSNLLTKSEINKSMSLSESDFLVEQAYKTYSTTAVLQGVGFGAGGLLLGLADFPALLSIKIKFLYDCARLYGYDLNDPKERLFVLYVFQLAFSSDEHRIKIYNIISNWDAQIPTLSLDWEKFQIEYRDYIDIAKMLQLLPIIGAPAGGIANYQLLEKLKVTAMNCYRLRYLARVKIGGVQIEI